MAAFYSRKWTAGVSVALFLCIAVAGCNRTPGPDVVAKVNGKIIQRSELDRYYQASMGQQQPQGPETPEQTSIAKLDVLRGMIDDEMLQQRAAKLNLVATDEEVDAKLSDLKAPYTQEEFNQQLKSKGMTLEDLRKQIRRSLTVDKLMNKEITSKINITDADISSYYNQNKSAFNLVEPRYHLAQIVVTTAPAPPSPGSMQSNKAGNDAEARKKIDEIYDRLRNGEDFGSLAVAFSEQPSNASNGGDMGFYFESQLRQDPVVFAAIAKLKPGQITDVLPSYATDGSKRVNGYAIYKLLSIDAAGQRELNNPQVQMAIRQQLRDARGQLLKNAYYEILRDQARVENYFAEEVFRNGAH